MKKNLLKLFIFFSLFAFGLITVSAQVNTTPDGRDVKKEDENGGIRDTIVKWRIKKENEDYQELIKRGEEALQIADELKASFDKNQKLSNDELKKLDKLEKLVKKIQDNLGGEDDDEKPSDDDKKLNSLATAINFLQENTANLLAELKKNTKMSISVIAVESSNYLMKILKFIRFNRN
jgi:hypothetical protein